MPAVAIAAVAAYGGSLVVAAGYGALAGALASAAIAYAGNRFYASNIARRPRGFSAEARDHQVLVRSAIEPRRVIYGEVGGLAGPLTFAHVSQENGPVDLDEHHNIPGTGAFTVTVAEAATYISTTRVIGITMRFDEGLWHEDGVDLTPVASNPGADEYSVNAGTYTFHSSRAGGRARIFYKANHPGNIVNKFFHLVIPLAGHEVDEIGDVSFGTDVITSAMLDSGGNVISGKYAGYVRIKKYLGTDDQTADADLIAESSGKWTTAHRGRGVAYIYVRLRRNQDLFPNGVPEIRAKVKGALLYDPRTDTTAWSDNWALAVYDYLTKPYGLGCAASEINTTALNAAANIADEEVEIDEEATTQARYTVNGVFSRDERPLDVLRDLVSTGAGGAIYSVSTWDVHAGAYTAPTNSLTISDLRGALSGRADLERRELFNGVRGTCLDPDRDWQASDFPPVTNATYVEDDNGEEIFRDVDLRFVTNKIRAQRLAKIYLERARQSVSCQWPGKPKLFRFNTWETMNVTVAALGWSPKVFRILSWKWVPGGGVDLQLQEEAEGIYDWNHGEATTHDLAPNTTLPNVGAVPPPGTPVVTEEIVEASGGRTAVVEVTISAEPAPDAYIDQYRFEYKLAAASQWIALPPVASPSTKLRDIAAGTYDWRVQAVNGLGRRSVYSQTRQEIIGLGEIPAAPVIRGLQAGGDGITAILTLEPHAELDVRRGGRWRVRHYEGDSPESLDAWAFSFSIGDAEGYPGDLTIIHLPLKDGSYLVKAEDALGQPSEDYAYIVVKQSSVHEFTVTHTLTEHTSFAGSKDNVVAVDGLLKLEGAGLVDDIPDWDAISSVDDYGGVEDEGTYTFSNAFNFGSVQRRRLSVEIQGATVNVNDLIDDREGNVDDWVDFDGDAGGGSADAWVEMRETDDNPAGAPVWSEWKRLDTAAVEAWGVQCRLRIISSDPGYNMHINTLQVTAEQVT